MCAFHWSSIKSMNEKLKFKNTFGRTEMIPLTSINCPTKSRSVCMYVWEPTQCGTCFHFIKGINRKQTNQANKKKIQPNNQMNQLTQWLSTLGSLNWLMRFWMFYHLFLMLLLQNDGLTFTFHTCESSSQNMKHFFGILTF